MVDLKYMYAYIYIYIPPEKNRGYKVGRSSSVCWLKLFYNLAVGPSLTSRAAVSAETPWEPVATQHAPYLLSGAPDLAWSLCFLILPVSLPAVGFVVGLA